MPVYVCRWQNGDFSVAYASNRDNADIMFDEVGNPDEAQVFTAPEFMVHFELRSEPDGIDDFSPFSLEGFGEAFADQILERGYPHYLKAVMKDDPRMEELEAVLCFEKLRLWGKKKGKLSSDPRLKALQEFRPDIPLAMWKAGVEHAMDLDAEGHAIQEEGSDD